MTAPLPTQLTGQQLLELRRAFRVVRATEILEGLAAYDAWRAQQPAHIFTDGKAPA